MAISLILEHGPHAGISRAEILRRLRAMIGLLQLEKSDVSFVLTNDETIHELNKVYRGKDRPTDVLAFAMHEGEFGALAGDVLGDVIVSVPTATNQAVSRGAAVLDEVTMLLAHGLLHLLGWDHDTAAKDRRMRAETARLCRAAEEGAPTVSGKGAPAKAGATKASSKVTAKVARAKTSRAMREPKARVAKPVKAKAGRAKASGAGAPASATKANRRKPTAEAVGAKASAKARGGAKKASGAASVTPSETRSKAGATTGLSRKPKAGKTGAKRKKG